MSEELPYNAVSMSDGARSDEWQVPLWNAIHEWADARTTPDRERAGVRVTDAVHTAMRVAIEENRRTPPASDERREALSRILGEQAKINALAGLLRDVRDILAYEADVFDSSRCADAVATIDEFMEWGDLAAKEEE